MEIKIKDGEAFKISTPNGKMTITDFDDQLVSIEAELCYHFYLPVEIREGEFKTVYLSYIGDLDFYIDEDGEKRFLKKLR